MNVDALSQRCLRMFLAPTFQQTLVGFFGLQAQLVCRSESTTAFALSLRRQNVLLLTVSNYDGRSCLVPRDLLGSK